jgi:hypothetical protein
MDVTFLESSQWAEQYFLPSVHMQVQTSRAHFLGWLDITYLLNKLRKNSSTNQRSSATVLAGKHCTESCIVVYF